MEALWRVEHAFRRAVGDRLSVPGFSRCGNGELASGVEARFRFVSANRHASKACSTQGGSLQL